MKKILFSFLIFYVLSLACFPVYAQNPVRDQWQQPAKIIDSIGVAPGMIIGEAGAGEGYLIFYLSKRVGETGLIYANDIKKSVLDKIAQKCKDEHITNIKTILGEVDDPLFPENQLEMVVMLRAFHDFTQPVEWMENVIPSLKSEAKLVIIDLDPERAGFGADHFMRKEKLLEIMDKTQFQLTKIDSFLQRDNIYSFKLKK